MKNIKETANKCKLLLLLLEFFTPELADGFQLECE